MFIDAGEFSEVLFADGTYVKNPIDIEVADISSVCSDADFHIRIAYIDNEGMLRAVDALNTNARFIKRKAKQ